MSADQAMRASTPGAVAGWGLHPLESAAFARRTPQADISQLSVLDLCVNANRRTASRRSLRNPNKCFDQKSLLLALAGLDHLLDFLFHRLQVEGSWVLHRRIFDCGLRQLPDVLLDHDEAPEFPGIEVVHIATRAGV